MKINKYVYIVGFLLIAVFITVLYLFLTKKECKSDSDCFNNLTCNKDGKCVTPCTLDCINKPSCGDDGCGGKCPCSNGDKCPGSKSECPQDSSCTSTVNCDKDQICVNGICVKNPDYCSKNKDCDDNQLCSDNHKCIYDDKAQWYCIKNEQTLNECKQYRDKPENSSGPYTANDCDNKCKNECSCDKGTTCLNNDCVPCSDNKITITNAVNMSQWHFKSDMFDDEDVLPCTYHNDDGSGNISFKHEPYDGHSTDRKDNWWDVININDNTFDLKLYLVDAVFQNFKITTNNTFRSNELLLGGKITTGDYMELYPPRCE